MPPKTFSLPSKNPPKYYHKLPANTKQTNCPHTPQSTTLGSFSQNTRSKSQQFVQESCSICLKKQIFSISMNSKLFDKYASSQNYYYSKDINDILGNMRTGATIKFKDLCFYYDNLEVKNIILLPNFDSPNIDEFLKRWYGQKEFKKKMELLTEYYKFHKDIPRLFMLPTTDFLNIYHDKKRRIEFYRISKLIDQENKNNPDKPKKGIIGDQPMNDDSDALNRGMDIEKKNNINLKNNKCEDNILKDISLSRYKCKKDVSVEPDIIQVNRKRMRQQPKQKPTDQSETLLELQQNLNLNNDTQSFQSSVFQENNKSVSTNLKEFLDFVSDQQIKLPKPSLVMADKFKIMELKEKDIDFHALLKKKSEQVTVSARNATQTAISHSPQHKNDDLMIRAQKFLFTQNTPTDNLNKYSKSPDEEKQSEVQEKKRQANKLFSNKELEEKKQLDNKLFMNAMQLGNKLRFGHQTHRAFENTPKNNLISDKSNENCDEVKKLNSCGSAQDSNDYGLHMRQKSHQNPPTSNMALSRKSKQLSARYSHVFVSQQSQNQPSLPSPKQQNTKNPLQILSIHKKTQSENQIKSLIKTQLEQYKQFQNNNHKKQQSLQLQTKQSLIVTKNSKQDQTKSLQKMSQKFGSKFNAQLEYLSNKLISPSSQPNQTPSTIHSSQKSGLIVSNKKSINFKQIANLQTNIKKN